MEWIKCSDMMPEIDTWVMVNGNGFISLAKLFVHDTGEYLWMFLTSNWDWSRIHPNERDNFIRNDTTHAIRYNCLASMHADDITYWMPLPPNP